MDIDADEIDVRVEGEDDDRDRPAKRGRGSDDDADGAADRARAARADRETVETRRYLLELEKDKSHSRFRELAARQEIAQHELREAEEADDADRRADAYGRIAALEAQRLDVERRSQYLNSLPEPQISDPVERFAATLTPRSANWVREHRDLMANPRTNAKVTGAHNFAVSEGLTPDSDEYFDYIERAVGLRGGKASRSTNNSNEPLEHSQMPQRDHVIVHRKSGGEVPDGAVKMTKNAYELATKVLTWNYDDPRGRFKRGDPIGVKEYLRRQESMKSTHARLD
jgi:hypothetical protein